MKIIKGKEIAKAIGASFQDDVALLKEKGITAGLRVILIGHDPAAQSYVRMVERSCKRYGVDAQVLYLNGETSEEALLEIIDQLNGDRDVHGILVQMPLPGHIRKEAVISRIDPAKDVDGFHVLNMGRLTVGEPGLFPCTPYGAVQLLEHSGIELEGKHAVVLGRSNVVGKPMALLLLERNATVTICHSRTKGLVEHARRADILIAAVGKPHFVTADMVKPGAVIVDVGIHEVNGQIVGDVDVESVEQVDGYRTPVPGGVGTTTIATLAGNTVQAALRISGIA